MNKVIGVQHGRGYSSGIFMEVLHVHSTKGIKRELKRSPIEKISIILDNSKETRVHIKGLKD